MSLNQNATIFAAVSSILLGSFFVTQGRSDDTRLERERMVREQAFDQARRGNEPQAKRKLLDQAKAECNVLLDRFDRARYDGYFVLGRVPGQAGETLEVIESNIGRRSFDICIEKVALQQGFAVESDQLRSSKGSYFVWNRQAATGALANMQTDVDVLD